MIDVSIVMPVYKKEKYLTESIESILHQTFLDFELICINDGSPDGCLRILEKFERLDKRIKILCNEQNQGAAYSRNVGIKNAVGEYIIILDADDIYNENLLLRAYDRCKKEDLDIVLFDYKQYNEKTGDEISYTMPLPMKRKCTGVFSNFDIEGFSFQLCPTGPWTKMYKRDFLIKNSLHFQSLPNSNDVFFSKMVFMKGKRIGYLEESLVKYRVNADFQISSDKRRAAVNFMKAMMEIKKVMHKENLYERNAKSFNTYAFNVALMHFFGAGIENRKEMYGEIRNGFEILFGENGNHAVFMNRHYFYWMQDFLNLSVEQHEQYAVNNEYKYIFRFEENKMVNLKKYIDKKNCKVVLWGYGKKGKFLAGEWKKTSLRLDCIVDINFIQFADAGVISPDEIKGDECIILVPTAAFVEDILKFCNNAKYKANVLDLQSYFTYGFELEECIFWDAVQMNGIC